MDTQRQGLVAGQQRAVVGRQKRVGELENIVVQEAPLPIEKHLVEHMSDRFAAGPIIRS